MFEPIRFGGQSLAAPATSKSFARLFLSAAIFLGAGLAHAQNAHAAASAKAVEAEGEVQVMVEDYAQSSRTRYFLKTDKGSSLEFKPSHAQERQLKTGAKVRLKGTQSGTVLALDDSSGSVTTVASAPLPNTLGDHKMAVLLVNFQDNPVQPYTLATGNSVISQVSTFYKENSLNQTSVSGTTFGWYTLPMASTCDFTQIPIAAKQAAANAGVNLSGYQHIVYVFPRSTVCSWAGQGTVGGGTILINESLNLKTLAHELGHNFGLLHSHSLECGATTGGTSCTSIDYGDKLDIMGNTNVAHFNSFQKERLGWLNNGSMPPITTVSSSGSYTLSPYESTTIGAKALKILKSTDATTGVKTYYYVEFRQPIGADAFIATMSGSNVATGVVIRTGTQNNGNGSYLLDMTPASSILYDWNDAALVLGQSFTDPGSGVTITPTTLNSTGATVHVSVSQTTTTTTTTCTRANPVITPATQSKSGTAGSALSYTVTVTNKDSSACSAASFNLKAVVPTGWTASFASPTLSLSPGASTSTTLTMGAPTGATGSTNASLSATNASVSTSIGSATATYTVGTTTTTTTSYTVTAATDKSVYGNNQTVFMSSLVKSGTTAVAGTSVIFTLTDPKGSVAIQNATTGSTGLATSSYRLGRVKGVYKLVTKVSGQTATGSKSFTLQ